MYYKVKTVVTKQTKYIQLISIKRRLHKNEINSTVAIYTRCTAIRNCCAALVMNSAASQLRGNIAVKVGIMSFICIITGSRPVCL